MDLNHKLLPAPNHLFDLGGGAPASAPAGRPGSRRLRKARSRSRSPFAAAELRVVEGAGARRNKTEIDGDLRMGSGSSAHTPRPWNEGSALARGDRFWCNLKGSLSDASSSS